ncbi:MAG TPA: response regulator transcription factor [Nitrospira sp.]|nr:response regulator transcription factor [Nitrospira sp.]
MKPIRLLLVDDHEVVRLGLQSVFRQSKTICVVGEACDATDAIKQAACLKPDVVVMEYRLSDASGDEACRRILAACPGTRVLFLTSFQDKTLPLSVAHAGASGFLLKQISSKQLIRAVETVAAGESVVDPAMTDVFLQLIRRSPDSGTRQSVTVLPSQQQRVLALLADGKTNREIAAILTLSEKTVINYVRIIFQKLGLTHRGQAAAYFFRHVAHIDSSKQSYSIPR